MITIVTEHHSSAVSTAETRPDRPFTLRYSSAEHVGCNEHASSVLDHLEHAGITVEGNSVDVDDIHDDIVTAYRSVSDAASDAALELRAAIGQLSACRERICGCADEERDHILDLVEHQLQNPCGHIWAVKRDGANVDVVDGTLNVHDLWHATRAAQRHGIDSFDVTWDLRNVTATFSSGTDEPETIVATPLDLIRTAAYETWHPMDDVDTTAMVAALEQRSDSAVAAATRVANDPNWNFAMPFFEQLLEMFDTLDGNHYDEARQIVEGLIITWDGRLDDLVATGCRLAGHDAPDGLRLVA